LAFSSDAAPRVVSLVDYREDASPTSSDLWISNLDGTQSRRLTTERGQLVLLAEWSPKNDRIAYIAQDTGILDQRRARLVAIDVPSGRKRVIAESGVAAPRWSRDGDTLFFFEFRSEDNTWRPRRISLPSGSAEPVSDLSSPAPGVFSPDGSRIAVVQGSDLILHNVATGVRTVRSLPHPLLPSVSLFSGDGRWLYLGGVRAGGIIKRSASLLVEVAGDRVIALDSVMSGGAVDARGAATFGEDGAGNPARRVQITVAGWVPGAEDKLLVGITPGSVGSCIPALALTAPENRSAVAQGVSTPWVLYSIERNIVQPVSGVETPPPPVQNPRNAVRISPDGRTFTVGSWLYQSKISL
jgi:dipeptidyl aminopeptidase/acylaminoacyl peptidase